MSSIYIVILICVVASFGSTRAGLISFQELIMEATVSSYPSSLSSFAVLSPSPCSRWVQLQRGSTAGPGDGRPRRGRSALVLGSAGKSGRDFGGELVDGNMAVLRKRIYELRRATEEGEGAPPSHWMEWEKRHHGSYNTMVCCAVGMLQSLLVNTRPSVALGVAVLVAVSVPAVTAVVAQRLMAVLDAILHGRW